LRGTGMRGEVHELDDGEECDLEESGDGVPQGWTLGAEGVQAIEGSEEDAGVDSPAGNRLRKEMRDLPEPDNGNSASDASDGSVEKTTPLNALETGRIHHYDFRRVMLENDPRDEGPETFTTEKAITDLEGRVVYLEGHLARPDYVDYQRHVIVDRKPVHQGEDLQDAYEKYQHQLDFYRRVYETARGVAPIVVLDGYSV
ncbi:MAG: hypothetical protein NUW23_16235, partial [Firmicutes bacterium]|nr:hypothetical protein [Bacillota bacterium]